MPLRFDALVIGGGPAGSTTAILLARAGWSVGLFEQAIFPRRKVCGEFISTSTLPLFEELGLDISGVAGPEVRRVGVFAAREAITADMPRPRLRAHRWGRAVPRERLDTMLLDRAIGAGVRVFQPATVIGLTTVNGQQICTAAVHREDVKLSVTAPVLIAAHGSWHHGVLPTQPVKRAPRDSDLLGFKARFINTRLDRGLMPLLAFKGGYGGLVHSDVDRVSLSCCIRRDMLAMCRRKTGASLAGEAVLMHMKEHCAALQEVLEGAEVDPHGWLATGPVQPGVRSTFRDGAFLVGNAAGEAHPVIAEGISMAMQSGWLLARRLIEGDHVRAAYRQDWNREFPWRIRSAAAVAHWAMRPLAVALSMPVLRRFPAMLTEGARTTGKVSPLCLPSS